MLVTLSTLLTLTTGNAGWFGNDDQLIKVENELHQQRQHTGDWMVIAGVLAVGCTVLFGIGAAIGSKARKEVKKDE
jgi:hypothetical protein